MRTFVIGDIHGAHKALLQCLEEANFDPAGDELICLGDVCDGWPETRECIDTLLSLDHLVMILGNHDQMTLDWALEGSLEPVWITQGGRQTIDSYEGGPMPPAHLDLLKNAHLYYIRENKLFVHAGILPGKPLEEQGPEIFLWNRDLFYQALEQKQHDQIRSLTSFDEVYIGHTPIHKYGWLAPVKSGDVWLMDTGAAWEGTLSMMDIHSGEVIISDPVHTFYPPGSGRS